ncbi:MAG: YgiQ family radical SAM protein [Synergistaceae bacterium]|jgi:uncharacterized radical SAM protein YgiQ|nr:YgiQ family radical SAM protein [Synergistaceae bacterium]
MSFLPVRRADMEARGWDTLDFLFVTGDAYVDHPSFAAALIGRLLERRGYRVGVVAQPDWRSTDDFTVMGRPRLGVLVGAGNLDSMLNRRTADKKTRGSDAYSPGGQTGLRPDRATIVYCQKIREIWGGIALVIGGVEASLRRFAHYDYWSDAPRRSILLDSQADVLVFGMGERQILQIAELLDEGYPADALLQAPGTCYAAEDVEHLDSFVELPSWEAVKDDKKAFAEAFRLASMEQDPIRGKALVQRYEAQRKYLVQLPPAPPLTEEMMDEIYDLPYARAWHPKYDALGGVPALAEVKFSVTSHRGCFGSCAFCSIHAHQGRIVQARSHDSILREVERLTRMKDFKGYVHDIGGPTANFRHPACRAQATRGACKNRECLFPQPCRHLDTSHADYLELLRKARAVKGVKKVFVRSGLRYDYLMADGEKGREFLTELCRRHVSGQLKVAPEHASPSVLRTMRKGDIGCYRRFMELFRATNRRLEKKQYLVPYFMTCHPGAGLSEAIELALFAAELEFCPEQAQDFIPTPGSLATCMYYTELDPFTGKSVVVVRNPRERRMQRALLQHRAAQNHALAREALLKAGRGDLIGAGKLVPPGGAAGPGKERGSARRKESPRKSERSQRSS